MKIGLVTPYIYPLPGGVNAHVKFLYEQLIARGHDVRIISSVHGAQRHDEGDVIRLGYGVSVPANGSVGTMTVAPRYARQVREMLERERFDVLHFHEPFVPFLSLVLLRESQSINVATFHAYAGWSPAYEFGKRMLGRFARRLHGRIAVSAAARHFIDRYFPGDYKVIPNGVDIARLASAQPVARYRDGTLNILFVGRFESRKGALYLLKAYRLLRMRGINCRLLMIGTGFPWSEFLPGEGKARAVQIDVDPAMLSLRYPCEVNLHGDAAETLRALLPLLDQKQDRSWRETIEHWMADWWSVLEARAMVEAHPVNPQRVVWELSPQLPADAIVTSDSGS